MEAIKEARLKVLICSTPESPNSAFFAQLDGGSPRWAPGAASVGDEEKLAKMQSKIRTQLGDRKQTNAGDKVVILGQHEVDGEMFCRSGILL